MGWDGSGFLSGDWGALRCDRGEVLLFPSMGLSCLAEAEVDRMTPEVWLEQNVHEEMKGQRGLDHSLTQKVG